MVRVPNNLDDGRVGTHHQKICGRTLAFFGLLSRRRYFSTVTITFPLYIVCTHLRECGNTRLSLCVRRPAST